MKIMMLIKAKLFSMIDCVIQVQLSSFTDTGLRY